MYDWIRVAFCPYGLCDEVKEEASKGKASIMTDFSGRDNFHGQNIVEESSGLHIVEMNFPAIGLSTATIAVGIAIVLCLCWGIKRCKCPDMGWTAGLCTRTETTPPQAESAAPQPSPTPTRARPMEERRRMERRRLPEIENVYYDVGQHRRAEEEVIAQVHARVPGWMARNFRPEVRDGIRKAVTNGRARYAITYAGASNNDNVGEEGKVCISEIP